MSVRELRWGVGKYTTFNEHDVFEGLGKSLPEAKDKDMGTPPVDSTASSTMNDVEDTQLSPTGTQSVDDPIPLSPWYKSEAKDEDMDDTTVLVAKPDTGIQKDLPATQGASPARLEDLVSPQPYWWISWPVLPLQLAVQWEKDRNIHSA